MNLLEETFSGNDEQLTTAHDYDTWLAQNKFGAWWVRFWFAPERTLFLNTPARKLPELLSLTNRDKILDIGCGYGGLLIYLNRRVRFTEVLEGLDCSALMVKRAQKAMDNRDLNTYIRIRNGFATRLPYSDGIFDVVLSTYVIKHLSDEHFMKMLQEVMRVLKPGGRFCLWEAAPSRNIYLQVLNLKLLKMGVSTAYLRTAEQLQECLEKAGFSDLQPYGHGPYYYYPPLPRVGFIARRPLE
ncbi:MAG: class I SAM-dependent methyltransferase [Geobacteraceae bacterium]